jgi:hypothetical protein
MKKAIWLIVTLLSLQSCLSESERGEIVLKEASPSKGFNYPYFLYIPEGASLEKKLVLIVEPNNSGFVDDDLDKHIEKAKRTATLDFYFGNYVAQKLKYPLLVPVFPRAESEWKIYTHALDRDVMLQKDNPLERIDLQLLAMVKDAENQLAQSGYTAHDKFFMIGFSASGSFTNRFTLIHPDKIQASAAGGVNGLLMLPTEEFDGKPLDYPLGTGDFQNLFRIPFDSISFSRTPQFYFMGELDQNDAIPYEDGYDINERKLVFELLGKEMQPTRWNSCMDIYKKKNVNARFKTYEGIGHEHPEKIKDEILEFFKGTLDFPGKSKIQKQGTDNQNANRLVSFLEGKWHNYSILVSDNNPVKKEDYKETMSIKNDSTITITAHSYKDSKDLTRDMTLVVKKDYVTMQQGNFIARGTRKGNVYSLKGYAGDKEYRFRLYTMGDKYVFHNEVWANGEVEMINMSYLERE